MNNNNIIMEQIGRVEVIAPILSDRIIVGAANKLRVSIHSLMLYLYSRMKPEGVIGLIVKCKSLDLEEAIEMICDTYLEEENEQ